MNLVIANEFALFLKTLWSHYLPVLYGVAFVLIQSTTPVYVILDHADGIS